MTTPTEPGDEYTEEQRWIDDDARREYEADHPAWAAWHDVLADMTRLESDD